MKHGLRRAVVGVAQIERQQRGNRLLAVERAHRAEAARFGKRKAGGAIGLERRRRIHVLTPAGFGAAGSVYAASGENAAGPIRRQWRWSQTQTIAHAATRRRRRRASKLVTRAIMSAAIGPSCRRRQAI